MKVGDIGEYVLVATDGINCDSELTISVNQSGIDYSGVDFLLPAEGLMNTPIASVDVSFPAVDSSMYIYEEDKVQILQVFENRTVFQFAEAGEYTIDWIANKEGCGKKFSKTIKIVETVEELENPELYQAFAGSLIDLGLYPNPNSGVFKAVISTSGIMDIDVSIYDMNGNVILSESYADETLYDLEFDISEMPAGPYSFFVSGGVDWKYVGFIKD